MADIKLIQFIMIGFLQMEFMLLLLQHLYQHVDLRLAHNSTIATHHKSQESHGGWVGLSKVYYKCEYVIQGQVTPIISVIYIYIYI